MNAIQEYNETGLEPVFLWSRDKMKLLGRLGFSVIGNPDSFTVNDFEVLQIGNGEIVGSANAGAHKFRYKIDDLENIKVEISSSAGR